MATGLRKAMCGGLVIGFVGCAACKIGAFPLLYPASGDIFPWVPTPGEHVTLSITDTVSGFTSSVAGGPHRISVSRVGNQITVVADWTGPSTPADCVLFSCQFQVDLGVLPVGQYSVEYSQGPGAVNPDLHEVTIDFSVTEQGYATAVEYFAPSLGHYFVTSDNVEIAALDSGTIPGWMRTGASFHVIPTSAQPTTALSVCRFYGLPQAGLNSHFFTSSQSECSMVQQLWPDAWILETPDAFAVLSVPGGADCAPGAISLYRLYNNRADANHRYTISPAIRDQMIAAGWLLEGEETKHGITAMCVPQ